LLEKITINLKQILKYDQPEAATAKLFYQYHPVIVLSRANESEKVKADSISIAIHLRRFFSYSKSLNKYNSSKSHFTNIILSDYNEII
jgi:hypothetical protein